MFGFLLGTMCLFGLFAVAGRGFAHRRWHHHAFAHGYGHGYGPGGYGPRGWHGHRGHGPGGWEGPRFVGEGFGRAAAEMVKRRLRVDEDQEDIVDHALKDARAAMKEYVEVLKGSRAEVAAAFRGETVDEGALAAVFTRHDEELTRARREVVSAFKQIHAVLTPEQRERAVEWLGAADPRWV